MVTKITDYSTTAGSNTDVAGISLAEGWAPSTVNNLLRALIAQMAGASQSEGGWLELQTSITAGTTQTIAGAYALTSPLSHVTTCANASDGVALPANVAETQVTIVNGGANDLKIWPNNGASDTINGGSANAADAALLSAGDSRTYTAINGTNWISHGVSVADSEAAYSGVLESNAGFVDQCLLGPAVDGRSWNGLWNKAGVFSSLMLATISDEGSSTRVRIWDLTEESAGVISTTPLATVDLSAAATPTSIAAAMGYLIVGSEDGIAIIDPHSGAWAERTKGWPRTLSTSTLPALVNNDVGAVAAGLAKQPALDPRTGGPHPSFIICYNAGTDACGVVKDDGNLWNSNAYASNSNAIAALDHGRGFVTGANDRIYTTHSNIDVITADDFPMPFVTRDDSYPFGLDAPTTISSENGKVAAGHAGGLSILSDMPKVSGLASSGETDIINSIITRAYNTGFFFSHPAGIWLANSKTADRSYLANTLTENGTVTEGVVETSAELNGYSGWTTSNYLRRAHDTDMDFGTADFALSTWFKTSTSSVNEIFMSVARASYGDTNGKMHLYLTSASKMLFYMHNSTSGGAADSVESPGTLDDGVWHKVDAVRDTTLSKLFLYIDGVLVATDEGPLTSDTLTDASSTTNIGIDSNDSFPATNTTFSLFRASTTIPTAVQVREMYDAEKGMFVASAECLLQSGSTDAVLDVDVDPLSGKVIVTQTDAITVFDGLVVDSKPTVNSGASEKGKLWGDLRAEQNAANAYVTAPATDQRQVNEMVRGLASELPAGVDLSKAKAWIQGEFGTTINASYNIKSITSRGTGQADVTFGVPFKNAFYVAVGASYTGADRFVSSNDQAGNTAEVAQLSLFRSTTDANQDGRFAAVFFGELENE